MKISQASYAMTRLFEIDVDKDMPDHFEASETQKHDNMSLIGALSWMASQTRPDLQVGVSMGQQRQKEPTVGDVRFTNQLARRALEHSENGLELHPIELSNAVLLCYHDAGWANVPQNQEDPFYSLSREEAEAGIITDGPFARKDAKAKKANSSIVSQLEESMFWQTEESCMEFLLEEAFWIGELGLATECAGPPLLLRRWPAVAPRRPATSHASSRPSSPESSRGRSHDSALPELVRSPYPRWRMPGAELQEACYRLGGHS